MIDIQAKTRRILKDCKAFIDGNHFVYSSGLHGDFYINKDALYAHPLKLDDVCVMMTELALSKFGHIFDVVVAPAISGVILGQNIAYNLSLQKKADVFFAYAEKHHANPDVRTIRRGYQNYLLNRKVLLVDDVVTTGRTLIGMAEAVRAVGGTPVGAVVICDRGSVRDLRYAHDNGPMTSLGIHPLVELDLKTFKADKCPFCKSGRPVEVDYGEGVAYHRQQLSNT